MGLEINGFCDLLAIHWFGVYGVGDIPFVAITGSFIVIAQYYSSLRLSVANTFSRLSCPINIMYIFQEILECVVIVALLIQAFVGQKNSSIDFWILVIGVLGIKFLVTSTYLKRYVQLEPLSEALISMVMLEGSMSLIPTALGMGYYIARIFPHANEMLLPIIVSLVYIGVRVYTSVQLVEQGY